MLIHKIEPGQTYRRVNSDKKDRIKVLSVENETPGLYGDDKVYIGTITSKGRVVRQRRISFSKLHFSRSKRDGSPRRTGYVLESQ